MHAERPQPRLELLVARALQPLAQHGQQLGAGAAVDEDDELEAEAALVLVVQAGELVEHLGLGAALLLRRLADARMRRERGDLVGLRQRQRDLLGDGERIRAGRKLVDEPRAPREQRRQLLDAQLPR